MRLYRDALGRLMLADPSGEAVEVRPVRLFPITDPDHFVSLCDTEGRERICVKDPAELPADTASLLIEELQRKEFLPVIQRIHKVSASSTPCEWVVDTDRGPTRFLLDSEDDVHPLSGGGVLIRDAHGTRYLVPATAKLDPASRRLLMRFL